MAKIRLVSTVTLIGLALLAVGCGSSTSSSTTTTAKSAKTKNPSTTAGGSATTAPAAPTTTASASKSNTNSVDQNGVPSSDMGGGKVQMYSVGQSGTLYDSADMVPLATITVAAPTFATSDSSGDTPQYGYFATFTVTVNNIAPASSQDTIGPSDSDFYVQTSNGMKYGSGGQSGVLGGNSFEATDSNELGTNSAGGTVELNPGQSTTGTVVIDVPSQHGQLFYAGGGQVDGAWAF